MRDVASVEQVAFIDNTAIEFSVDRCSALEKLGVAINILMPWHSERSCLPFQGPGVRLRAGRRNALEFRSAVSVKRSATKISFEKIYNHRQLV